jgi:RNA polymerase sigma-70 factor (ECF subfamily)
MYRRYSARVHGVCRRMLGNTEDAREAAQETFLKAYQGLPRFNGQYKLGAWLARIAANVCVDHIRRNNRTAVMTPLEDDHESPDFELGPEDMVVRDAPALSTLETIQPLHAHALKLRNLEGFSHKEIAEQLDISPMQAKALLHRARVSFKRAWENASGWVLAPIAGLRSLVHHGSKDATSIAPHLQMWTQTASPLFAERMAASAMVVVVALSGTGSGGSSLNDTAPIVPVPVASAEFAGAERATAESGMRAATTQAEATEKPTLVADVEGLLEKVREKAEAKSEDKRDRKDDDDDGDGEDLGPGSANQASQKLVEDVHDTVEDAGDSLPNR